MTYVPSETELKIRALEIAGGDLGNAKRIFEWLKQEPPASPSTQDDMVSAQSESVASSPPDVAAALRGRPNGDDWIGICSDMSILNDGALVDVCRPSDRDGLPGSWTMAAHYARDVNWSDWTFWRFSKATEAEQPSEAYSQGRADFEDGSAVNRYDDGTVGAMQWGFGWEAAQADFAARRSRPSERSVEESQPAQEQLEQPNHAPETAETEADAQSDGAAEEAPAAVENLADSLDQNDAPAAAASADPLLSHSGDQGVDPELPEGWTLNIGILPVHEDVKVRVLLRNGGVSTPTCPSLAGDYRWSLGDPACDRMSEIFAWILDTTDAKPADGLQAEDEQQDGAQSGTLINTPALDSGATADADVGIEPGPAPVEPEPRPSGFLSWLFRVKEPGAVEIPDQNGNPVKLKLERA